jgi:hypothetical protein
MVSTAQNYLIQNRQHDRKHSGLSQVDFRENAHSPLAHYINKIEFALSGGQGRNCEKYGAQMTLTG